MLWIKAFLCQLALWQKQTTFVASNHWADTNTTEIFFKMLGLDSEVWFSLSVIVWVDFIHSFCTLYSFAKSCTYYELHLEKPLPTKLTTKQIKHTWRGMWISREKTSVLWCKKNTSNFQCSCSIFGKMYDEKKINSLG